jgi:hypothetical protein
MPLVAIMLLAQAPQAKLLSSFEMTPFEHLSIIPAVVACWLAAKPFENL